MASNRSPLSKTGPTSSKPLSYEHGEVTEEVPTIGECQLCRCGILRRYIVWRIKIYDLAVNQRVTITWKVLSAKPVESVHVKSRGQTFRKQDFVLGDSSSTVVVWRGRTLWGV